MFLHQIHDTAATHAVTMHVPIGVLVLRVPLDDDGMRSVAHFGTGVGRAFHDFPSQLQQEIGQRNGCFYLIEIDFHNVDWIS
jgi:hypothetical protein